MEIDSPEFQNYLEEIHDVSLVDICDQLDIPLRHRYGATQIICPFHNDQNFGSCIIKHNRMTCYACGESADGIKLVRHVLNLNFFEACDYIADLGGIIKPQLNHQESVSVPTLPVTDAQLELLGLNKRGTIFNVTGFATQSTDFQKELGRFQWDANGYLLGEYQKVSLMDLYQENPMEFHMLIIGKLFYCLTEKIAAYLTTDFSSVELQKECEHDIEDVLWPLAQYYAPSAHSYGYDFSFLNKYQRRKHKVEAKFAAVF